MATMGNMPDLTGMKCLFALAMRVLKISFWVLKRALWRHIWASLYNYIILFYELAWSDPNIPQYTILDYTRISHKKRSKTS